MNVAMSFKTHTLIRSGHPPPGPESKGLLELLLVWEPGIKHKDALYSTHTLLFPSYHVFLCVCVWRTALGADVASWFPWFTLHKLGAVSKPTFEKHTTDTGRHAPKHTNSPSLLLAATFSNKRNTDSSTLCPHTLNIPSASLFVPFKGSHLSTGST